MQNEIPYMRQGSTKIERMLEERYYIYPPRAFLFQCLVRIWLILFLCILGSIGPLTALFFVVYVFLYFYFKPFLRLWSVYYKKISLFLMTIVMVGLSYLVAPVIRNILWQVICSF